MMIRKSAGAFLAFSFFGMCLATACADQKGSEAHALGVDAAQPTANLEVDGERRKAEPGRDLFDEAFRELHFPKGVSVRLPRNWVVLDGGARLQIDDLVNAQLADLGLAMSSDLAFTANHFDDAGRTIALFNIRYYPDMDVSQSEVANASSDEINQIDLALKGALQRSADVSGFAISGWKGTRRLENDGYFVLLTEYSRSYPEQPTFRVRLVRVLNGSRSFTITVSYQAERGEALKVISDEIIRSIRQSPA